MNIRSFQYILDGTSSGRNTVGRPKTPVEKQLCMFLWTVGGRGIPERATGSQFGVSRCTVQRSFHFISQLIYSHLQNHIEMPSLQQMHKTSQYYHDKYGFPDVMGSIDGSFIPIRAPFCQDIAPYLCRKDFICIVLQALVDCDMKFLHVYCGWPGSAHDARIFRNCSSLFPMISQQYGPLEKFIILADSAYPLLFHLIPPFKEYEALSPDKLKFNRIHNACRSTVERAFGRLKGRFQSLKYGLMCSPEVAPIIVTACCILHNVLTDLNDEDFHELTDDYDDSSDYEDMDVEMTGADRRDELMAYVCRH